MPRVAPLLALVLFAGCASSPADAPSPDAASPSAPRPANDGVDAAPEASPRGAHVAYVAALASAESAWAEREMPGRMRLFTATSEWFPREYDGSDPLLPLSQRPLAPSTDPADVPVWQFSFVAGEWSANVVATAAGEVLETHVGYVGVDIDEMLSPAPPLALDPTAAHAALRADPRARPAFDAPLAHAWWTYTAAETMGWEVQIATRTEGGYWGTWTPAGGWDIQHTPQGTGLRVLSATALRETRSGDVTALAYELALEPGGEPMKLGGYGGTLQYTFPGPPQVSVEGRHEGYYALEWLDGDGTDGSLDLGDRVRLTWRVPDGALGPGQHVGLLFAEEPPHDLSVTLPDTFGDALEIRLPLDR